MRIDASTDTHAQAHTRTHAQGSEAGDALLAGGGPNLAAVCADWAAEHTFDVLPRAGRIVVFDSKLIHEVRPCTRQRRALTLFIDRPVMDDARGETWDGGLLSGPDSEAREEQDLTELAY